MNSRPISSLMMRRQFFKQCAGAALMGSLLLTGCKDDDNKVNNNVVNSNPPPLPRQANDLSLEWHGQLLSLSNGQNRQYLRNSGFELLPASQHISKENMGRIDIPLSGHAMNPIPGQSQTDGGIFVLDNISSSNKVFFPIREYDIESSIGGSQYCEMMASFFDWVLTKKNQGYSTFAAVFTGTADGVPVVNFIEYDGQTENIPAGREWNEKKYWRIVQGEGLTNIGLAVARSISLRDETARFLGTIGAKYIEYRVAAKVYENTGDEYKYGTATLSALV